MQLDYEKILYKLEMMDFIEERDNSKANEKNRSDDVIEFVKKLEINRITMW